MSHNFLRNQKNVTFELYLTNKEMPLLAGMIECF